MVQLATDSLRMLPVDPSSTGTAARSLYAFIRRPANNRNRPARESCCCAFHSRSHPRQTPPTDHPLFITFPRCVLHISTDINSVTTQREHLRVLLRAVSFQAAGLSPDAAVPNVKPAYQYRLPDPVPRICSGTIFPGSPPESSRSRGRSPAALRSCVRQ